MTTFIGTTWEERAAFIEQEDRKNAQLDEIAAHYDTRCKRRWRRIDEAYAEVNRLRGEIARLEAKIDRMYNENDRDRNIWHAVLDRHIARDRRIIAMWDELQAAETTA